ncbi:hypothetical protein [Paenibacillus sp. CCS19]|uniref:hypothetical protein n=1 Tax=Paenibacillus sp. CCS19 TaxID=3158387 RepID=UPI00295F0869|nr:hypothetical protein [Paenibacillus cellulosilyticus]
MQLAAISMGRSADIADSINQIDGRQHHIFDYLMEEVFRRLPDPLRNFMMDTSILRRMNRALCHYKVFGFFDVLGKKKTSGSGFTIVNAGQQSVYGIWIYNEGAVTLNCNYDILVTKLD